MERAMGHKCDGRGVEPQIMWSGRFIQAVKAGRWEYVRRCGVCGAVGIVAVTRDRKLVLVRQYRPPVGQEAEELVTAARRELLEETGYRAAHWRPLLEGVTTAGLADESVTLFLATGLAKVGPGGGDEHEEIAVHEVALEGFETWVRAATEDGSKVDVKVYLAAALARDMA
jgi:ADP-ribose pyrophosphatase